MGYFVATDNGCGGTRLRCLHLGMIDRSAHRRPYSGQSTQSRSGRTSRCRRAYTQSPLVGCSARLALPTFSPTKRQQMTVPRLSSQSLTTTAYELPPPAAYPIRARTTQFLPSEIPTSTSKCTIFGLDHSPRGPMARPNFPSKPHSPNGQLPEPIDPQNSASRSSQDRPKCTTSATHITD